MMKREEYLNRLKRYIEIARVYVSRGELLEAIVTMLGYELIITEKSRLIRFKPRGRK